MPTLKWISLARQRITGMFRFSARKWEALYGLLEPFPHSAPTLKSTAHLF